MAIGREAWKWPANKDVWQRIDRHTLIFVDFPVPSGKCVLYLHIYGGVYAKLSLHSTVIDQETKAWPKHLSTKGMCSAFLHLRQDQQVHRSWLQGWLCTKELINKPKLLCFVICLGWYNYFPFFSPVQSTCPSSRKLHFLVEVCKQAEWLEAAIS